MLSVLAVTCGDAAFTIDVMNEQTTGLRRGQRIVAAAHGLAPAGITGLGGVATHLMGWPVWQQMTILGTAAVLGGATTVNTAIAHGRRRQSAARRDRISTDDHAHLVKARRKVMNQLAKPGLSRQRRRDLERTLAALTHNPLDG